MRHIAIRIGVLVVASILSVSTSWAQSGVAAELRALEMRSNAAVVANDPSAALSAAREAVGLAESRLGRDAPETLAAVDRLYMLHFQLQNYAEAKPLLMRLIDAKARALGRDHPDVLGLRNRLGRFYSITGQWLDARTVYADVLKAQERVLGVDHYDTLRSASNLAVMQINLGRIDEAEPLLKRVLQSRERKLGANAPDTLLSVFLLARFRELQGRTIEAEALFLRAVQASEQNSGFDLDLPFNLLSGLGDFYAAQGAYAEAEPLLKRVAAGRERLWGPYHPLTLGSQSSLAALLRKQKRLSEAEALIRSILTAREQLLGADHIDTLGSVNELAVLAKEQGRFEEAEPLFVRALAGAEKQLGSGHPNTLTVLRHLAEVRARQGRRSEAEGLYRRLLSSAAKSLGDADPLTLSASRGLSELYLDWTGNETRALDLAQHYGRGVLALKGVQSRNPLAEKQGASDANGFLTLADAAWAHPQREELADAAFKALQDAMAPASGSALVEAVVRRIASTEGSGVADLARQRQDLSRRWTALGAAFAAVAANDNDASGRARFEIVEERNRIAAEIGRVNRTLLRRFPRFDALVRPAAVDLAKARRTLAEDEAILIVLPGTRGTHVMAVTKSGRRWVRSEWTADRVRAAVKRLMWDVGADAGVDAATSERWEEEGGPGYPFDRKTAFALYGQVVAPVANVIAGKKKLFVIAGDALAGLPFGILVTEPPQGKDGDADALRATPWFADQFALSVVPSVQSLVLLRESRKQLGKGATGFTGYGDPVLSGPPQMRGTRGAGARLSDPRKLMSLSRLPGTAMELEALRIAFGAPANAIHLREAATEAAIKEVDLTRTRVIAFATHGLVSGELGLAEPGLVFTPPQTPTERDDGLLGASEVATLRLDADWVILSACNTAASDPGRGGEAFSGLARSFFYAGARSLLVSHWPVRDEVAAKITARAIEIAKADPTLGRSAAVQRAAREIRNDPSHDSASDSWAHPNAWAAFSLVGDGAE